MVKKFYTLQLLNYKVISLIHFRSRIFDSEIFELLQNLNLFESCCLSEIFKFLSNLPNFCMIFEIVHVNIFNKQKIYIKSFQNLTL